MSSVDMSKYNDILPTKKLQQWAEEHAEHYQSASPHAHAVFDDVFEPWVLHEILKEFDEKEKQQASWKSFDTKYEKKLQLNADESLGPHTRALINNLNSGTFLLFLEQLTGISGLIADPYLSGGGLHKIERGGKLGIHIDFNHNETMNNYRRINVLVYLNENWEESYGGHFELWSDTKGTDKAKILPIFNRMAIFSTTANSFHGHPEPLNCPPERSRKSIALYYYTTDKDKLQSNYEHSTVFVNEKGQTEELGRISTWQKIKNMIKKVIGKT